MTLATPSHPHPSRAWPHSSPTTATTSLSHQASAHAHAHSPISTSSRASHPSSAALSPISLGQTIAPSLHPSNPLSPSCALDNGRSPSPNYFGLALDSRDGFSSSNGLRNLNNWSPPTSNIRSTAAASPRVVPLDQNPEFDAFRRASEASSAFNFSNLGSFSLTPGPRPASSSTRPSIGRTFSQNSTDMPPPSPRTTTMAASGFKTPNKRSTFEDEQKSPKRLLSSPSSNIIDRPRRASPASFTDRPDADEIAQFLGEERSSTRMSMPPTGTSAMSPPTHIAALHRRAETLPMNDAADEGGEGSSEKSKSDGTPEVVTPQRVVNLMDTLSEDVLLLDLRVSAQYCRSRISGALNLCVPTMFLKRPSFNVHKLADTFGQGEQRVKFERWRSCKYIVVYDAQSAQLKDATTCLNTLRKFALEGWTGRSYIVRGGFDEFSKKFPARIAHDDPYASVSGADTRSGSTSSSEGAASSSSSDEDSNGKAFATRSRQPSLAPPVIGGCPMPTTRHALNPFFGNIRQNMDLIGGVGQMAIKKPARLAAVQEDSYSSSGIGMYNQGNDQDQAAAAGYHQATNRLAAMLPEWLRRAADDDDGGRQVADKFLRIEKREQKRMQEALSGNVTYGATAATPAAEQHSSPGNAFKLTPSSSSSSPTARRASVQLAGIEKGQKNRYNNIWPYEHSRVKIQGVGSGACDYVNANFVQSAWSSKRYIATQGPIPTTFVDFWKVVWQQDVRVIVMLTAESEGGQIKAHNYWDARQYGPFQLTFLSEHRASLEPERIHRHHHLHRNRNAHATNRKRSTTNPLGARDGSASQTSGQTNAGQSSPPSEQPYVIVRTFTLSHGDEPFAPIREITQLQYANWPDFGAPAHPAHLLGLVEQCNAVVRASGPTSTSSLSGNGMGSKRIGGRMGVAGRMNVGGASSSAVENNASPVDGQAGSQRPVLVHCSAGCGRTGTFCTVDTVIDLIKHQQATRKATAQQPTQSSAISTAMDMDVQAPASEAPRGFFDLSAPPPASTSALASGHEDATATRGSGVSPATAAANLIPSDTADWLHTEDLDLIEKTVEDFRSQRLSMVQSLRQYVLCYESVLEWLTQQHELEELAEAPRTA